MARETFYVDIMWDLVFQLFYCYICLEADRSNFLKNEPYKKWIYFWPHQANSTAHAGPIQANSTKFGLIHANLHKLIQANSG